MTINNQPAAPREATSFTEKHALVILLHQLGSSYPASSGFFALCESSSARFVSVSVEAYCRKSAIKEATQVAAIHSRFSLYCANRPARLSSVPPNNNHTTARTPKAMARDCVES